MKIYDTDPEVYARTTKIKPDRTKAEIDGLFARYGIKDVWWRYDLKGGDIFVQFILSENFEDKKRNITVKIEPHPIYTKKKRGDVVA